MVAAAFFSAQLAGTIAALFALLRLSFPERSARAIARAGVSDLLHTREGRLGGAAVLALLGLGLLQNRIDPWFTELAVRLHGTRDFAVHIHAAEGAGTAWLQGFAPPAAIHAALFAYVCLLPALWGLVFLGLHAAGRPRLLRAAVVALLSNGLLALPFFLLLPVRETWMALLPPDAERARLLLHDLRFDLEPLFRGARGVENNFPSLHTSLSVTAWLLLRRAGSRLAVVSGAAAALVAFSTLYLGFHWIADLVAGVVLAFLSVRVATRDRAAGEATQATASPDRSPRE
jgi:membrane-associated phospholipid phosphatase